MIYSTIEITGDVKNAQGHKIDGDLSVTKNINVQGEVKNVSGGGATKWGKIKGDIHDQTDLIDLLDLKADKTELSNYVLKETGKGLSTNDFTNTLKSKLEGIESGAEVNTVVLKSCHVDESSDDPTLTWYIFDMTDANGNVYNDVRFYPVEAIGAFFAGLDNTYVTITTFNTTLQSAMQRFDGLLALKADASALNDYWAKADLVAMSDAEIDEVCV